MLIRRRALALLGTLALGSTALGAIGCGGGLSTGDHAFYWVSVEAAKPQASCYPDQMIPDSVKDDVTTIRSRATFVLYVTGDAEAELDTGTAVLPGKPTDAGYSFQGNVTDVEYPAGTTITDADHDGIDDAKDPMVDADMDGVDDKLDDVVDTDGDGLDDRFQDDLVDADKDGKDDRIVAIPSGIKLTTTSTITIDLKVDGNAVSGSVTTVASKACEGTLCPKDVATSCTKTSAFTGVEVEQTEVHVGSEGASGTN